MNKVITIHLHGVAFQLEEGGYDALRTYLDQAERQLAANPDKTEILADIEQAIADKFRALLNTNRNGARTTEVAALIAEIGLLTDSTSSGTDSEPKPDGQPGSTTNAQATDNGAPPKKSPLSCHRGRYRRRRVQRPGCLLRRRRDVRAVGRGRTPVPQSRSGRRRLFHCCQHHPEAKTAEEKAAAGPSPTAQEFIRKARDGY